MKKIMSKILFAAAVLSMTAMAANAAEPSVIIDFGKDSGVSLSAGTNIEWFEEDNYAVFTATAGDPYITMDDAKGEFDQMKYVKVRVWNESPAAAIELFGVSNGATGYAGNQCTHIDIAPNKAEWQEVVAYIPDSNVFTVQNYKDVSNWIDESVWGGTVTKIRLDPMWQEGNDGEDAGGSMTAGDSIKIDYVAFFATEADAKAYTQEAAAPAPEASAPTETPAAPSEGAAQTADMAAVAVLASVLALGTAVVVSKKR